MSRPGTRRPHHCASYIQTMKTTDKHYRHKPLVRSSQPVGPCGSEMQGSGFGGGQILLRREGSEKEVGVVRTRLTTDFSDFVHVHPTPLKMPRGDRELAISWQELQELGSTVRVVTSSFSGGVQICLPKEPSVILVLFSGIISI